MASTPLPDPQITLSNQEARRFMLAHHGLWPPRQIQGKQGILALIRRLGCVQFDTINVVGRNADLLLQARVADYTPNVLDEMLYQDRLLIDGWDKVASIYPVEDWPNFARHREEMAAYRYQRLEGLADIIPEVLAAIREHGPISSLHFKDAPKTDWFWSATSLPRAAMETLLAEGRIGISHRVNTRREYDVIENLVSENILAREDPHPQLEDYHAWHITRRIGGMGLAATTSGEHWQGIRRLDSAVQRQQAVARLVEQGDVLPVAVEGLDGQTLFIRQADQGRLREIQNAPAPPPGMAFIAPLDNLIWNRKLIGDLFDFKYVWEVYKPKHQREYGYYVLPVVYGDAFVARVDMKLDRKTNTIDVFNWWWEPGGKHDGQMAAAAKQCFSTFKAYLGAGGYRVDPQAKNRTFLRKVAR